ncbi:Aste57867_19648 [Aphanomyces stellatus]|uniref:Aste57867_19648 protein n=1 Tax=Aphanomyces stellatus TaxID=120398 RepID=A0A485LEX9_9STRA|nr:hypothetical protein As57867_019583 [Aphanomyces stellatus]VFT96348.1 Aste57867_19648 [Aphanomyces stellatus]
MTKQRAVSADDTQRRSSLGTPASCVDDLPTDDDDAAVITTDDPTSDCHSSPHLFISPTGALHGPRVLDEATAFFVSKAQEDEVLFIAPVAPPPTGLLRALRRRLPSPMMLRRASTTTSVSPHQTPSLAASCVGCDSSAPPTSSHSLLGFAKKTPAVRLWRCRTCPDVALCGDCYGQGIHGMEDQSKALLEAKLDLQLMKLSKRFSRPLLRLLRLRICADDPRRRLARYVNLVHWLADVVGTTPLGAISMRGIEFRNLHEHVRQEFVALLMPLMGHRADIAVYLEWATAYASTDMQPKDDLRLWVADKKDTKSPFVGALLEDMVLPFATEECLSEI